jgi:putative ABC transport system permease protein
VLLSQETVNDFQLAVGDPINLRLLNRADHATSTVPFHFVGVISEFPTAPKDSFLVANAAYLAAQTHNPNAEIVLVRSGTDPSRLAATIRAALGPATPLTVSDVTEASHVTGSSLTAVDLRMLTSVELAFAVLLVIGSTGLVLWLGLIERRANADTLAALGAAPWQIRLFPSTEAAIILVTGALGGLALGELVATVLVKMLAGAFDPPPDVLQQPWASIIMIGAAGLLALWVARMSSLGRTDQNRA